MLISTFECPYCLRARETEDTEGFFIVDDGVVVIEHEFKKLMVFDKDSYKLHGLLQPAALEINLAASLTTKIVFRRWRSRRKRFQGGRMLIVGTFESRRGPERITLKTDVTTYQGMKDLVQQLLADT
jgi:hypothetical protein